MASSHFPGDSGAPSGSNTQIQFNDNNGFGASADLSWDGTEILVGQDAGTAETLVATDAVYLAKAGGNPLVQFTSSGGGTIGSPTASGTTDLLADLKVLGTKSDNATQIAAELQVVVDGTVSAAAVTGAVDLYARKSDGTTAVTRLLDSLGLMYLAGAVQVGSYAFANLPTPAAGMMAYITNSNTQVWGATIAAASPGSPVLAWYNGTNWTVAGK